MSLVEATAMIQSRNFRMAAVEGAPEWVFVEIYNRLSGSDTLLEFDPDTEPAWKLSHEGEIKRLHRAKDALRVTHIGDRPGRRVRDRYTDGGRFAPDPGDTVVDVGSFIGELAWQVCEIDDVQEIIAIEPDPRNARCAAANTPDRVDVKRMGAFHKNTSLEFNIADDGSESSLLAPDKGHSVKTTVACRRLESILEDKTIDWMKVEAEGLEPEVLLGLGDLRPGRIVVNVSPERNGASPANLCEGILANYGYETELKGDELFATLKQDSEINQDPMTQRGEDLDATRIEISD